MKSNTVNPTRVYAFPGAASREATREHAQAAPPSSTADSLESEAPPEVMVVAGFGEELAWALRDNMPERAYALVAAADAEQTLMLHRVYGPGLRYVIALDDGAPSALRYGRRPRTWTQAIATLLDAAPGTVLIRLATRRDARPRLEDLGRSLETVTVGPLAAEVLERVWGMSAVVAGQEATSPIRRLRPTSTFPSCEEARAQLRAEAPELVVLINQGASGAALCADLLRARPSLLVLTLDHLSHEDLGAELHVLAQITAGLSRRARPA